MFMKIVFLFFLFVIVFFEGGLYNLNNGLKKLGNVWFLGNRIMKSYIKMFIVVYVVYKFVWFCKFLYCI